jgi:hypothetical protein
MGLRTTSAEADFDADAGMVFDAFSAAVASLRARVERQDREAGRLEARTRMGIRSWGERVTVEVSRGSGGRTHVVVSSKLRAQLVDWGKNKENVERIMRVASATLPVPPAASGVPPSVPPPPSAPGEPPPLPPPPG